MMKVRYFASLCLAPEVLSRETSEILLFSFLTALSRSAVFLSCAVSVRVTKLLRSLEKKKFHINALRICFLNTFSFHVKQR